MVKQFLDLNGLTVYDENIKSILNHNSDEIANIQFIIPSSASSSNKLATQADIVSGNGDMNTTNYDPNGVVANAGGINQYVDEALSNKVDKVEGKELSTNDFTDNLKDKLVALGTAASAAPDKIASTSVQGTSTNYARQDHTHGIDLATGDANGQVKIAGVNIAVKGLGSNAYTNTTIPTKTSQLINDSGYSVESWTAVQTLAENTTSIQFTGLDTSKAYDLYCETADGTPIYIIGSATNNTTITYTIKAITSAQAANSGCKAKLRIIT